MPLRFEEYIYWHSITARYVNTREKATRTKIREKNNKNQALSFSWYLHQTKIICNTIIIQNNGPGHQATEKKTDKQTDSNSRSIIKGKKVYKKKAVRVM